MTPQARRPPALPVFKLSSLLPFPKSSAFSWIWNTGQLMQTQIKFCAPTQKGKITYHHGSANNWVWAGEGDHTVCDVEFGHLIGTRGHVAEVADMPVRAF